MKQKINKTVVGEMWNGAKKLLNFALPVTADGIIAHIDPNHLVGNVCCRQAPEPDNRPNHLGG